MRVFTFLMMMAVAIGGTLVGYRLVFGRDLVSLSEFGLASQPSSSITFAGQRGTAVPTLAPTAVPSPTLLPPTSTPVSDLPQAMVVGNTGGEGVFVRATPHLNDKLRAWRDGSRMEIIGKPVDSDGLKWIKVRAPDGAEGYIPESYLANQP